MVNGEWCLPIGALLGEGFASKADYFKGSNHAAGVPAVNSFVSDWVALGQLGQQIRQRNACQFCADGNIGRRGVAQAFKESFEVKARPAAKDGQPAA